MVSADAEQEKLSPKVAIKNDQLKLGVDLRDKLVAELAKRLSDRICAAGAADVTTGTGG